MSFVIGNRLNNNRRRSCNYPDDDKPSYMLMITQVQNRQQSKTKGVQGSGVGGKGQEVDKLFALADVTTAALDR